MKKHLIILLLVITSYAGFSRDLSLVIASNAGKSRLECLEISFGNKTAKVVLKNGEKMAIPVNSIRSYTVDGKEFTKMPLFINNRPIGYLDYFWDGTEDNSTMGRARLLSFEAIDLAPGGGLKKNGYSVRCVKD